MCVFAAGWLASVAHVVQSWGHNSTVAGVILQVNACNEFMISVEKKVILKHGNKFVFEICAYSFSEEIEHSKYVMVFLLNWVRDLEITCYPDHACRRGHFYDLFIRRFLNSQYKPFQNVPSESPSQQSHVNRKAARSLRPLESGLNRLGLGSCY